MTSLDATLGRRSPLTWRTVEAVRLGWLEYVTLNPPLTLLTATLPRGVLQIVFFTVFGGVIAGPEHRAYVFVGALALALSGTNVSGVANVPIADKHYATFWRVRTGALPSTITLIARAASYPVVGFGLLLAEAAIAAPILGLTGFAVRMLPWLWIYALMACTLGIVGLAAATLTIGKRADVLAPNVLAYLIVLCSGAFLPPGRVGWIDAIGSVLPARHGLAAVHAAIDGRPWLAQVGLEIVVGVAFTVLTALVVLLQTRRASRLGHDDFT